MNRVNFAQKIKFQAFVEKNMRNFDETKDLDDILDMWDGSCQGQYFSKGLFTHGIENAIIIF